ncbi:hypothetical protein HOA59_01715 [archaeon]|jgi:hypothetical protein|nr:hypothetical protein [archaeon]MBT6824133.1 hypothetical protein [archaeon]MBT7107023.1 hypothetical protein [archaeon]MBT7297635.1 hypothetical protein [archaeon]
MEVSFKLIFGLVIGIGGVFLAFTVGSMVWSMFFSDSWHLTEQSIENLKEVIEDMDQINQNSSSIFYLVDGYYLVGFDKGTQSGTIYERPEECFNAACLVVCKSSLDPRACISPVVYTSLDNIVSFQIENGAEVILAETKTSVLLNLEKQGTSLIIKGSN